MRVDVVGGLALGVTVRAGGGRVEVDARFDDGGLHLRPIAFRVVAGEAAPGLHRDGPARIGEGRRGLHPSSVASDRRDGPVALAVDAARRAILEATSTRGGRTRPAPTDPALWRGR